MKDSRDKSTKDLQEETNKNVDYPHEDEHILESPSIYDEDGPDDGPDGKDDDEEKFT